ncbi:MAG: ABC transporter substrate-binding protein [Dehalococcoidales bacterium]|nr:ABC transporter substrate-binding protein [Dehalococcoidales bacterium]
MNKDTIGFSREVGRRDILRIGVGAVGLGLLSACAPTGQPASTATPRTQTPTTQAAAVATKSGEPRRGGSVTLAYTSSLDRFNPMHLVQTTIVTNRVMWNTLIRTDTQLNPQPELAEEWALSADGKVVTMKLRQGVKFHSGREFTSEDVKATWEFATTDEYVTQKPMFQTIKAVETPDKYTVVLRMDEVYPGIFDLLDAMFIIDHESIGDASKNAVGTGPFRLDKFVPNERVEMVAFKDYWEKGKPYLDRVVHLSMPDLLAAAIALESGHVDCVMRPAYTDVARLMDAHGGKYAVSMGPPGYSKFDLAVNVTAEHLKDKRVRQAIAHAVNRERFCRTTLYGLEEPSCLIWPSHSWAYFPDLEGTLGYDLDKAKSLLKEVGLDGGFDLEIMTNSKGGYGFLELGQILQADLKSIGVNARVVDLEPAVYTTRLVKLRDIQVATHAYGRTNRDPGTTLTAAKSWHTEKQGAWTHFESDEYDNLRTELQTTIDREKRKAICRTIQEMALDECFTIPVSSRGMPFVYASHVKDFATDFEASPFFGTMWVEK